MMFWNEERAADYRPSASEFGCMGMTYWGCNMCISYPRNAVCMLNMHCLSDHYKMHVRVVRPLQCFRTTDSAKLPVINGKVVPSHPSRSVCECSSLPYQPDICIHLNEVSSKCQLDFNTNGWYWRGCSLFSLPLFLFCRMLNGGSVWCISFPFRYSHYFLFETKTAFLLFPPERVLYL